MELATTGMVRATDPDTSYEAAASFTKDGLTEIQLDVYNFFLNQPNKEATDEELEDVLLSKYPATSTVKKRRTDLFHKGLLCDSGTRRKNRNNRNMIVWKVV